MAAACVRYVPNLLRVVRCSSRLKNNIYLANPTCSLRINTSSFSSSRIALITSDSKDAKSSQIHCDESPFSQMSDPYVEEIEPCLLCKSNIPISFKNLQLLSQFVSPNTGKIYDRKITKLCQSQHDRVVKEINIARQFGLMPFIYRETVFLKDPSLYEIQYTGNANIGDTVELPLSTDDWEEKQQALAASSHTDSKKVDKPPKKPLWKSGKFMGQRKKRK